MQSEKSKKAGNAPPITTLIDLLKSSLAGCSEILLLDEDVNFNSRAVSLSVCMSQFFGFMIVVCLYKYSVKV